MQDTACAAQDNELLQAEKRGENCVDKEVRFVSQFVVLPEGQQGTSVVSKKKCADCSQACLQVCVYMYMVTRYMAVTLSYL